VSAPVYRAVAYLGVRIDVVGYDDDDRPVLSGGAVGGAGDPTAILRSSGVPTRDAAVAILDRMLALADATGGCVEEYVTGIGWCLSDAPDPDDDLETVGERGVW